jgi:hypothetical protein
MVNVGVASGISGKQAHVTDDNALLVSVFEPVVVQSNSFGKIQLGGGTQGTVNAIRLTPYFEQPDQAQRALKSTSANDSGTGTGARRVRITYFDALMHGPLVTDVIMNGLNPAPTSVMDMRFIEKMEVIEVGSGGTNSGPITLTVTAAGTGVIGSISVGTAFDIRTYWAHHYIANNTKLTIGVIDAGTTSGVNAEAFMEYVNPLKSGSPEEQIFGSLCVGGGNSSTVRPVAPAFLVVGPARLTMYVIPAGNTSNYFASFDWKEEPITTQESIGLIGGAG